MIDPIHIREDFPIFRQSEESGRPLCYLDNAATAQTPEVVVHAMQDFYGQYNANVHRAFHQLSERATGEYEEAREVVASFIGAEKTEEVIFTRGTTESINTVAQAWGTSALKQGDEILLTEMEHHSNLIPWQSLARQRGLVLRFIPVQEDGTLDLSKLDGLISDRTGLVAVTQMSNVLGTINSLGTLIQKAHAVDALVLVDAAQSVVHRQIDVRALDCDFLAFSGHKLFGPTGIGILYGKKEILSSMPPFMTGGEMVKSVEYGHSTWADLPQKLEAGTPNIAGAVGLKAAVRYVRALGFDAMQEHEDMLTVYALDRLSAVSGVTIVGSAPERGGVVSFDVEGVHPHDMAQLANEDGVAIRAGHMCAQPLVKKLGYPALSRASFTIYNTTDDIDRLVNSIQRAREFFCE